MRINRSTKDPIDREPFDGVIYLARGTLDPVVETSSHMRSPGLPSFAVHLDVDMLRAAQDLQRFSTVLPYLHYSDCGRSANTNRSPPPTKRPIYTTDTRSSIPQPQAFPDRAILPMDPVQ